MFGRRKPSPEELKEEELERARAVTPVSLSFNSQEHKSS